MSGGLLSNQNFGVKFDKVNWPTFFKDPSYVARENSVSFPPTGPNRCFHKGLVNTFQWNLNIEESRKKNPATT